MANGQVFVLAIVAITTFGGIVSMWVKARHGYPIESPRDRIRGRARRINRMMSHMTGNDADDIDSERKIRLLSDENEKLVGKIGRLEERLAVLERIATDPAERTAREIDALRDR